MPWRGASQVVLVKNSSVSAGRPKRCGFHLWVGKILWRRAWQLTPIFLPGKFHGWRSLVGYSPCRVRGDLATKPYPGEGNGNPLQCSCLENPMDRGAWQAAVHGVAQSRARLSNFTFTFHFHALEKETETHSCVLAWRIPGMGEPGELLSMGSHRVRHD